MSILHPTGFRVGERMLIPDVAFVSIARIPDDTDKASPIPPDLAVEVVSPTDVLNRIVEKAFAYLESGTQLVWVVEPKSKTVMVYRSETDIKLLTRNDTPHRRRCRGRVCLSGGGTVCIVPTSTHCGGIKTCMRKK